MSISISNLSKKYGDQIVLNNISFEIGEGEVVGFLGPNGAGKTTTMRILAGAITYERGSAKICGMEVNENQLKTSALIGYLPEQNPQYTDMYVKEYLLFVADTYKLGKEKEQRVNELIDLVGLRPEFQKKNRSALQRLSPTCGTCSGTDSKPESSDSGRTNYRS